MLTNIHLDHILEIDIVYKYTIKCMYIYNKL